MGKTLIMAIYHFTIVTGIVVLFRPDGGGSAGLLGRKLSEDFRLKEKEIKR